MAYEVVSRPGEKPKAKYEVVSKPKGAQGPQPGASLLDHYMRLMGEGVDTMREGAGRLTAPGASGWERTKGAGQTALGALQYVGSPFSAAMRRIVGNPAEVVAGGMGASPETQTQVGDYAGMAGEILGPAGAVKAVQNAPRIAQGMSQALPLINRGATAAGRVMRGGVNAADDVAGSLAEGARSRAAARTAEREAIPSKEVLKTAGGGEFEAAKALGGGVRPEVFQTRINSIRPSMSGRGVDLEAEETYPNARQMISYLERRQEGISSFENLMTLQKEARNYVKRAKKAGETTGDDSDYRAAQITMKDLDDFVAGLTPEDMVGGSNPEAANEALRKAKELWARQAKLDVVDDILEQARRVDDVSIIQKEFRKLALNDYEYGRFTPAEQKMIEKLARKGVMGDIEEALPPISAMRRGTRYARKKLTGALEERDVQKFRDMIARGKADQEARAAAKAAEPSLTEKVAGTMGKKSTPERDAFYYAERARKANEKRNRGR